MQNAWPQAAPDSAGSIEMDAEEDVSRRPPNAFILYSQSMRTTVRQDNPTLSNNEVSRLLGKMWKEVPADIKLQFKQQASAAQEDFKRQHPNYTYRKARRKRALNELLTKSTQGFGIPNFPGDPSIVNAAFNPANPALWQQMYAQPGLQGALGPGQVPGLGLPNMGMPNPQGYPNLQGYPGLGDQGQNSLYQLPPK
jgi:transcription factor SOX7/8/10/18 (SOX group E/F)